MNVTVKKGSLKDNDNPAPGCSSRAILKESYKNNQNPVRPHQAFIASLIASNKRKPLAHCENCGGDGGWLEPSGRFDVCPCCEGTGELPTSERALIDLDDLDTINRDKPAVIAECDLGLDCPFRRICLSEGRTC